MAKLYALMIKKRLDKKVVENKLIGDHQIGFKKGHRTADHIFVINTIVNKVVRAEKKKLFSAFIDFEKAYDRINRNLLLL